MARRTKRLPPAQHEMIVAWVLGGAEAVGRHSTRTFHALVRAGYLDRGAPTKRAREYVDRWALGGTREELEAAAERELFGEDLPSKNNVARKKIGEVEGRPIYFEHVSYHCPSLGLYGYATERQLRSAIKRKLRKKKGNPMAKKKKMPDVTVEDQGTVVVFSLLTSRAREWFNENVQTEPWQWLSERKVAVEPRAAEAVGGGMLDEGLRFG